MVRSFGILVVLLVAIALAACDDEETDCGYINNPCTAAGASQCSADGNEVERCTANTVDGCLLWTTAEACSAPAVCTTSSGEPSCGCADACDALGDTRCSGTIVQTCQQVGDCLDWADGADCAPAPCDESSGTAACDCVDACETAGAARCAGAVIEACAEAASGCLAWLAGTDCAAESPPAACDESGAAPVCVPTCAHECEAEGVTCDFDVVVTCDVGDDGCLHPTAVDCASMAPPQACWDAGTGAACVVPADGETCETARAVRPPYAVEGDDVMADFAADLEMTGPRCWGGPPDYVDAVFAVALLAGETLSIRQTNEMIDWATSFQLVCGAAERCEDFEWAAGGRRYTAEADGTVYVTFDMYAWGDDPSYRIEFSLVEDEVCTDGVDNNLDNRIDCEDPECFGTAGCSTETACNDGLDNDLDHAADCNDDDCAALPDCDPIQAVYENFDWGPIDLEGRAITFTPAAADPSGYTWTQRTVTAFTTAPGSGLSSTVLALTNDDVEEILLEHMPGFVFYGITYTSFFVADNGVVSFSEGVPVPWWDLWLFRQRPMIAGYWHDLWPVGAGTITVDEFADRVAVTYDGIPICCSPDNPANSFQIVMRDDGTIEIALVALDDAYGLVGLSRGLGREPFPPSTDFYAPAPENCTDGADNDGDGRADCDDTSCWGEGPCTTELDCWDWFDNDLDGLWNCADPDCAAVPDCMPEDCDDGVDNNANWATDCQDRQCWGVPPCDVEDTEPLCSDGWDNDLDGYSDCADSDCAAVPWCIAEVCDDGVDNNENGVTDCDDWDCFGEEPACSTELNCLDRNDNDYDGLMDCDDDDCIGLAACEPALGVWEQFSGDGDADPVDLANTLIWFVPDAGDPDGYTYTVGPDPGGWLVSPGSGMPSTTMTLDDDDFQEYPFAVMGSFPFFTETYTSIFVASNGYITFGTGSYDLGDCSYGPDCFMYPIIMALRTDLYPPGGTVTVDEFPDGVAVTFDGVPPCCDPAGPDSSFQIALVVTGEIYLQYHAIDIEGRGAGAGIGTAGAAAPPQVDFLP